MKKAKELGKKNEGKGTKDNFKKINAIYNNERLYIKSIKSKH